MYADPSAPAHLLDALPRQNLLGVRGLPSDRPLARRVRKAVRAAWHRLDRDERRDLVRHWDDYRPTNWAQPDGTHYSPEGPLPFIELVDVDLRHNVTGARCWAVCSCEGHVYRFARDVAEMPDDVLEHLVAHELLHGLQHAEGTGARTPADLADAEVDVLWRLAQHGYDDDGYEEWLAVRSMRETA